MGALWVAKAIIEAQGGSVNVTSRGGQTTFSIQLHREDHLVSG